MGTKRFLPEYRCVITFLAQSSSVQFFIPSARIFVIMKRSAEKGEATTLTILNFCMSRTCIFFTTIPSGERIRKLLILYMLQPSRTCPLRERLSFFHFFLDFFSFWPYITMGVVERLTVSNSRHAAMRKRKTGLTRIPFAEVGNTRRREHNNDIPGA